MVQELERAAPSRLAADGIPDGHEGPAWIPEYAGCGSRRSMDGCRERHAGQPLVSADAAQSGPARAPDGHGHLGVLMPKLIHNWKRAHRMISVQLMALTGAIQAAWPSVPEDLKAALPHNVVNWLSIALLISAVFGRLLDQGSTTEPQPPGQSDIPERYRQRWNYPPRP